MRTRSAISTIRLRIPNVSVHDVFSLTIFFIVGVIGVAGRTLVVCGQTMPGEQLSPERLGSRR